MQRFISVLRIKQSGNFLLTQRNPAVYSSNDVLQKKIHSPAPVSKLYKDLTLNRALSFVSHYTICTNSLSGDVTVINTRGGSTQTQYLTISARTSLKMYPLQVEVPL